MADELAGALQRARAERLRRQIEAAKEVQFDKSIDRVTGALADERNVVGSARNPGDKLATARQYYPDAQPYGDDNILFMNPRTGRPTLFNPPGLDVGDVASVTGEISEVMGGIAGGIAGLPAGPVGALAGVGFGAAATREVHDLYMNRLFGTQDTRGGGERLVDAGVTAAMNTAGQKVGEVAGKAISGVFGPMSQSLRKGVAPGGPEALDDFAAVGVTPRTPGAVTGNRGAQMIEQGLANTPAAASVMQEAAERTIGEFETAAEAVARSFGPRRTVEGVGETVAQGSKAAGMRFKTRREALDEAIEAAVGADVPVPVQNAKTMLATMQAELAKAPETASPRLQDAIAELEKVIADAANGGIPFKSLRQARTALGLALDRPDVSGYSVKGQAALRRAYDALSDDIIAGADAAGPEAGKALRLHDRYVQFNRNVNLPTLDKIDKAGTDVQAWKIVESGSRDSGQMLARMRRNLTPEEWDVVAGSVMSRLGKAPAGQQGATELGEESGRFSISSFMRNYNNLAPEARKALFGGSRYADLEAPLNALLRVGERLKDADRMANSSGTARVLGAVGLLSGVGNVFFTGGGALETAGALGGLVVAPRVAARLITSPRFVRWLARAGNIGLNQGENALAGHIGRLVTIAEAEPEIREDVYQYLQALRSAKAAPTPADPGTAPPTPAMR
jgi:hypothetical protein